MMKSNWQNQNYVHICYKENAIHQIVRLFMVYYAKHVAYTVSYPISLNKMKNIEKVGREILRVVHLAGV